MANPTLTPFPTPPLPEQDEVTFNRNAANSLLAQANFVGEANTVVTWMGQQIDAAAASKKAAADAAAAAGQAVTDAQSQVKLATDQAVASKGSADAAAGSLASVKVVASAVDASAGLPPGVAPGSVLRQKLDGSGQKEWWQIVVSQVGDTIVSTQAPDSTWANTGTVYFQAQYPKLFAKLGKLPDWQLTQAGLTATTPGSNNYWVSGAYGNGKFVLACLNQGNNAHCFMVTADFGASWQLVVSPANNYQYALTWNGSQFVSIPYGAYTVQTSTDGISWSQTGNVLPTGYGAGWSYIAYGNGVHIAGVGGSDTVVRNAASPTSAWSLAKLPDGFAPTKIVFAIGQFVAVFQGSTTYYTSTDGLVWTKRTGPASYGGTLVGNDTTAVWGNGNNVWASNDLVNWTFATTLTGAQVLSISAGPGCFIAAQNANGLVSVSSDGLKWFSKQMPWNINFNGTFYYGNSYFLAPRYNDVSVFRVRAFSYNLANQFYTTDSLAAPSGLNQYIKAS